MADASGLEISKVYTCYRLDATRPTLHIPDPNRFFGFLLFGYRKGVRNYGTPVRVGARPWHSLVCTILHFPVAKAIIDNA